MMLPELSHTEEDAHHMTSLTRGQEGAGSRGPGVGSRATLTRDKAPGTRRSRPRLRTRSTVTALGKMRETLGIRWDRTSHAYPTCTRSRCEGTAMGSSLVVEITSRRTHIQPSRRPPHASAADFVCPSQPKKAGKKNLFVKLNCCSFSGVRPRASRPDCSWKRGLCRCR